MPSRDELLASPEIPSNLSHLKDHLVQLPIVPIGRQVTDCGSEHQNPSSSPTSCAILDPFLHRF